MVEEMAKKHPITDWTVKFDEMMGAEEISTPIDLVIDKILATPSLDPEDDLDRVYVAKTKNSVKFFSHGRRWEHLPYTEHPYETLILVVDIRGATDWPPTTFAEIDGMDERIQTFIKTKYPAWVLEQQRLVYRSIIEMLTVERFTSLHIHFICNSGVQRSVAIVEILYAFFYEKKLQGHCALAKKHCDLEEARELTFEKLRKLKSEE